MKDNTCYICTEQNIILIQLPTCKHTLCKKCWFTIIKLSGDKPKCPYCRQVQPTKLYQIQKLIQEQPIIMLFLFFCFYVWMKSLYIYIRQNILNVSMA